MMRGGVVGHVLCGVLVPAADSDVPDDSGEFRKLSEIRKQIVERNVPEMRELVRVRQDRSRGCGHRCRRGSRTDAGGRSHAIDAVDRAELSN